MASVHGPIAPVTFNNAGCQDIYDHGHSVTAPPSPCNAGPAKLPVTNGGLKVAAATKAAEEAGDAREAAAAAKETAEAQEALKPKEAGAAKAAKSEAEGAGPPAPAAAKKEPAKAALIQLDGPPIEPVTFEDSFKCT